MEQVREDLHALHARLERGAAMAKEIQEKNERFLASMGWKAGQKGEKGVASGEKGVASTTSRVGAAPAAVQQDQAAPSAETVGHAPSQLDEAGEAILSFWLIRGGGGAGGDAALAEEFFEHGDEVLDAQKLGERLHTVLGVDIEDPEQLLARLLSPSARCTSPGGDSQLAVLSPGTLQRWVHGVYPLFELEQLLLSDAVQLHKIVARHLARGNGQDAPRTREEVHDCVLAAASDIADAVYAQIEQVYAHLLRFTTRKTEYLT